MIPNTDIEAILKNLDVDPEYSDKIRESYYSLMTNFTGDAEAKKQIDEGFYEEARKILEDVRSKDTSQHYAILAMIRIADTYYDDQQYDEAAVEYENFLNVHPFHKYAAYAQYKLGMTYFKKIKTVDVS